MRERDLWIIGAGAVLAGGALAWYVVRHTNALNPMSPDNLAYSGVNALGAGLTGDPNFRLGVKIWDVLNPDARRRELEMLAPSAGWNAADAADADSGYYAELSRAHSGAAFGLYPR